MSNLTGLEEETTSTSDASLLQQKKHDA